MMRVNGVLPSEPVCEMKLPAAMSALCRYADIASNGLQRNGVVAGNEPVIPGCVHTRAVARARLIASSIWTSIADIPVVPESTGGVPASVPLATQRPATQVCPAVHAGVQPVVGPHMPLVGTHCITV